MKALLALVLFATPAFGVTHADNPRVAAALLAIPELVAPHSATCDFYFQLFGVSLDRLLADHRISILAGDPGPDSVAETRMENNFASEIVLHPALFANGDHRQLVHTIVHELGHLADFNAPYKALVFDQRMNLEGGEVAEVACLGEMLPGELPE